MHALSLNVARRIQSASQLSATLAELLALIGEGEPTRAASYASAPIAVGALQTTIDSTTGSQRAVVRRGDLATTGSKGKASTGALVVRPIRMRLFGSLAVLTGLLVLLWWLGTRGDDAPSPRPGTLPPVPVTDAPPTPLSTPPVPAAMAVPLTTSDAGAMRPAEPISKSPRAPGRVDRLDRPQKRLRQKQGVAPAAPPLPEIKDATPAPSEVGRSKSQFAPNDFY